MERFEIGRVYPRLQTGGAEVGILQLLDELPDTHMIVTAVEGPAAERARKAAARYTLLDAEPRLPPLVEALAECRVLTGDLHGADAALAALGRDVPEHVGTKRLRAELARCT